MNKYIGIGLIVVGIVLGVMLTNSSSLFQSEEIKNALESYSNDMKTFDEENYLDKVSSN